MFYKEYIKVESDFIPVFSSSSDRIQPEKWKSFYPHDSFKKILTSVVDTLEKGSATKDRPIWISGSYGTGKTFRVVRHQTHFGRRLKRRGKIFCSSRNELQKYLQELIEKDTLLGIRVLKNSRGKRNG